MIAKTTILLGILIVASAAANVYLYQRSAALENTITQLTETNNGLRNRIENNNQSSTIVPSPTVNGTLPSNPPQISNPLPNGTNHSITAVAVKTVPVTDGFFQSVQYEGTVMDITVDIREGRGLVLVNTETPTGVDFQTSARTAVQVAQVTTGADLSERDVIFSIKSKDSAGDLQIVDGPSAGAAMTVLLAAELEAGDNVAQIKQDVLMTGTINSDGTVGPVGGIPEKAIAAGIRCQDFSSSFRSGDL